MSIMTTPTKLSGTIVYNKADSTMNTLSILLERYLRDTQNTYELLQQLTIFKNDKNKYTITSAINTPNGTKQINELKWEIRYDSYWPKNTYNVNKNQNNTNDHTEELN
eukprot:167371_1